ncbi:MAG: toll/interleukin-1 receptor domain-containing protein [Candidatus Poribacteria bacterium]|nr:toll/interleukin-1 receptor domain-containing protein [Candidatus Poribacteria bacterium]
MNLTDFENDIFISYTHVDNRPLVEEEKGWIEKFHNTLEIRLAQLFSRDPRIWRDLKLRGNDIFGDEICEQLPKASLLISVLSPRYIVSKWCIKEVKEFCKAARKTGGIRIGNKARVFKVVKTPIPREQHPPELQGSLGYEFFELDPNTGRAREFNPIFGREAEMEFVQKLDDLAHDIRELLEKIENGISDSDDLGPPVKGIVYLAETTSDLREDRDAIRRELQEHGYMVLPDQPLPLIASEFENLVQENLSQSKLSIHLVGKNYGFVPEGARQSSIELQNELAAQRSQDPEFSRLIWIPSGIETEDERQQAVIENLQTDASAQRGAELLETSLEDLKTVIHDKLNPPAKPDKPSINDEDNLIRVYLIYDQRDVDSVQPLEDYLRGERFEVIPALVEGGENEVREYHTDSLRLCDAVIIYYGQANESWVRVKQQDLRKAAGYGREKPMLAKAIYVAGPKTSTKERFQTLEAEVIKHFDEFSSNTLESFLTQIEAAKGGQE